MQRMKTKEVRIGNRVIGGDHPVLIQSMTNTKTENVADTVAQIKRLTAAGCDIIRCAVPTKEAAAALKEIKKQIHIPLVADITLITALPLQQSKAEQIRSGSIREISAPKIVCVQWLRWQKNVGYRSVLV